MAGENGAQHIQGIRIDITFDIADDWRTITHDQYRQFRRRFHGDTSNSRLLRLILGLAERQRTRLQAAVVFFGGLEHRLVIHIADDDDVGIVGHVPALVPVPSILHRHVFQIVHPADDRPPIRVRLEGHGIHRFKEQRLRLVVGTQTTLLHDHLDLLLEFTGRKRQVAHAIGFQTHHLVQTLLRHLLEVGGVIAAGESIVTPPGRRHQTIELSRPDLRRSFEHHVLKHMGDPSRAVGFVHRSGAVPDHVHRRRRPPVLLDDHPQAVRQLVFERIRANRECSGGHEERQPSGENVSSHCHGRLLIKFVRIELFAGDVEAKP